MTGVSLGSNAWVLTAFVLYLGMMIAIGLYSTRFSSSGLGEFFLGGRKMKSFVVALSAVTAGRSAWLIIGMSGMAYVRGVSAIWAVVGYVLMELFMFVYAGRRLRIFTGKMDNLTIPDYLESRLADKTRLVRTVSLIPILIFMVAYVAAQFTAGGKALSASFGINPVYGILITAGVVLFYTMMGGFLAVCLTDVFQAMFMIFALVLLPAVAIVRFGGLPLVLATLKGLSPQLLDPFALSTGAFLGFIGIGLGSPGNPHILNKYMSIQNPERLRASGLIGTVWNVIMAWGALYIGLVGRAMYSDVALLPAKDPENIYPLLGARHLHPFIFGLTISAIFAAIMSTADSQLLVASSALIRDIYQKILAKGKEMTQRQLVFWSRTATIFIALIAFAIGVYAKKLVFYMVLFAWGGLGAAFGPAILLSLYWKRLTKWGVAAGIFIGTAVEIIWYSIPALKAAVSEWVPATILSGVVVIGVSLLTKAPAGAGRFLEIMKGKE